MNEKEAIKILNYQLSMKDTDVYIPINCEAIQCLISRIKELESIEQIHREDNGKLREELKERITLIEEQQETNWEEIGETLGKIHLELGEGFAKAVKQLDNKMKGE